MEESILNSIKNSLGIHKDLFAFDQEIMMNTNSVFSTLNQLAVPFVDKIYTINGPNETWSDLFGSNDVLISMIKTYTFIKVKILFDPPSSSFVLESLKAQASELEWRINIEAEGGSMKDDKSSV